MEEKKADLTSRAKELLDASSQKIDSLKAMINNQSVKLSGDKEEALKKLETQRDTLQAELAQLNDTTQNNWEQFKTKLNQDMENLQQSVSEFFTKDK